MTNKPPVYTGTNGIETARDTFLKNVLREKMDPDSFDEKDERQLIETLAGIFVFIFVMLGLFGVCTIINSLILLFYLFL